MSMRCNDCDIVYQKGKFCTKCGKALIEHRAKVNDNMSNEEDGVFLQQAPNAIANAPQTINVKEEKDVNKKNKKFKKIKPSKTKKRFKGLKITLLILLFLIIGTTSALVYYLNNSQIDDRVDREFDEDKNYLDKIIARGIDEDELVVLLDTPILNGFIEKEFDENSLALPMNIKLKDFYYDANRESMVAQLNGFFINTSLLFDIKAITDDEMIEILAERFRIGDKEIPLPKFLSQKIMGDFKKQIFKQLNFFTIGSIDFDDEGLNVVGEFNTEYMHQFMVELKEASDPNFLYFVSEKSDRFLPAYQSLIQYKEGDHVASFLPSLAREAKHVKNWLIILDKARATELLNDINLSLPTDAQLDVERMLKEAQSERAHIEVEYKDYFIEKIQNDLSSDLKAVYKAIEKYHDKHGLPSYVLASNGRVYSQTLGLYLTIDMLIEEGVLEDDKYKQYQLYSKGESIILGVDTEDGFKYRMANDRYTPSEIKTASTKEDFLTSIHYKNEKALPVQLLTRGNGDRDKIADLISDHIGSRDSIYVRYLSSDGINAFLVCSSGVNSQIIYQYLLEKNGLDWKIVKSFNQTDNVKRVLMSKISDQTFNVRVLPPFEVVDFKNDNYSTFGINSVASHLYNKNEFSTRDVHYFSKIDNSVFITSKEGDRVLLIFNSGSRDNYKELVKMDNDTDISSYHSRLEPHEAYNKYLPIFVFYQD